MRDRILREKDRVQKELWREAGGDSVAYASLVHDRARLLRKDGLKLRYVRSRTSAQTK
jgi:hypothetical protein